MNSRAALTLAALACGALYLGYLCILYLTQGALIYPGTRNQVDRVAPRPDGADLFHISTTKGNVEALFLPASADASAARRPAVIFGHGNGEVIDYWVSGLRGFQQRGVSVLLVEYPGYGRSTGSPSEQSIRAAMDAAYDRLAADPRVDPDRIFGFGQSLGGGAVCLLARTTEAAESHSRLIRLESMNVELRATVKQLHASLAERDAELQRATRIASTNAYALGRVQSSIDELGRGLTASEGAPAEPQVSILTRIDRGQNHSFVLRARTTIARNPDNDLSLAMGSVSRHHAVLIPAFHSALLQDLGSTNGVLVNKRRVRCARLEHGDVIKLGEAQFRYTVAPVPADAVSVSQVAPRRRAQR